MRILLALCGLAVIVYAAAVTYPRLDREVDARLPLLTAYYLSRQLEAEIRYAGDRDQPFPPQYASIVTHYEGTPDHPRLLEVRDMSASRPKLSLFDRLVMPFVLWRRGLPRDFMSADPVAEMTRTLDEVRQKERKGAQERSALIDTHVLECLRQRPAIAAAPTHMRASLPPAVVEAGLTFCGEAIPLYRPDVRRRIEYQLAYLLNDFRETSELWLRRADRYGAVIEEVLRNEAVPVEFRFLPALESGYHREAVSPAAATGWWQFVKPTALRSASSDKELDWSLSIDRRLDQRKDLALSTQAAARYLKWMRSRLGSGDMQGSWLTTAAAYNAGFDEVRYRCNAYGTPSYWDMKLPLETENYVPRWIAFAMIEQNRTYYGVEGTSAAPLTFETLEDVRLAKDVPLALVATLTHASVRFIREINGGLRKGETVFKTVAEGADRICPIHVPSGTRELILEQLKARGYVEERR
jgi:membrane-bound lytic murein transglycosylase D